MASRTIILHPAYYNAGSAALSLFIIALVVGLFLLCRRRRRNQMHLPIPKDDPEETIPLQDTRGNGYQDAEGDAHANGLSPTGGNKTVFEVGDSDGEEESHYGRRHS